MVFFALEPSNMIWWNWKYNYFCNYWPNSMGDICKSGRVWDCALSFLSASQCCHDVISFSSRLVTWYLLLRSLTSKNTNLSRAKMVYITSHTSRNLPLTWMGMPADSFLRALWSSLAAIISQRVSLVREICQYFGVFRHYASLPLSGTETLCPERWVPLCAHHRPLSLPLSLCCSNKPCSSSSEARNCKLWECG